MPTKTLPRNYAADAASRPALLLLKFKTTKARNAIFRARAKLAETAWGFNEDLTPLQPQFLEARKVGKQPRWKGNEFFVDGRPVRPST